MTDKKIFLTKPKVSSIIPDDMANLMWQQRPQLPLMLCGVPVTRACPTRTSGHVAVAIRKKAAVHPGPRLCSTAGTRGQPYMRDSSASTHTL